MESSHTDNYDFQHGYNNGLEKVTKDTYEGYLSSQVHYEWQTRQIADKQHELTVLETNIEKTKSSYKNVFDQLQNCLLNIGLASKNKKRVDFQLFDNEMFTKILSKKRENSITTNSLLSGLIYLISGIAFIGGDLIISHEIVAYALNIRNNTEAWIFAVGLALVSVLLKPAYERLIESPYSENPSLRNRTIYAWFKGTMVVFATITLFILGWFRYEAYKTDKLKEGINKSIKSLQTQSVDPLNPSAALTVQVQAQIQEKLRAFDTLNQDLVNSPWALASFVLSGVLFAFAGAICLGLSFPVLQSYWFRWFQIDPKIKRLENEKFQLNITLSELEKSMTAYFINKNIFENDIVLLPKIETLELQKENLLQEIKTLKEQTRLSETDARIAAYNDGFAKGEMVRDSIEIEEINQIVRDNYFTTSNLANKAKSSSGGNVAGFSKNKAPLRPFQQLRKMISDDFNGEETL
jgi:hypothetical protein